MKKLILFLALICATVSMRAQIATQNSNALDNIGVGVTVGATAPLDFNDVLPLNTNFGLKLTKDISPKFGLQLEALGFLNDNHFSNVKTAIKATNVGLNGVTNLSNLFGGYKGTPRLFEVGLVGGLGWLHTWNSANNFLSAKTGLDLSFNMGKKKAHSLVLTPAVYWNLNKFNKIQFNKNGSQLALNVTYVYHFKTSNGTHHFKTYDIGAMNDEINYLKGRLDECEKQSPKIIQKIVERQVEKKVSQPTPMQWLVQFAKGNADLSIKGMETLNTIKEGTVVEIVGMASPEGSHDFNMTLSNRRAKVVADYLETRGVKVKSCRGIDTSKDTNRLAIVTIAE